jgi:DNA polymerase-3 subunit beta
VASHPQLPVLANIKLKIGKKSLELSTTDLQTGVVVTLESTTSKAGETTVPAKIFSELVASLPPQEIKAEVDGNLLKLACGSFSAEINCLGAEEFPEFAQIEGKPLLVLPAERFTLIVEQVAFAAAADEGRPVLTGVFVRSTNKGLVFTATDGYRMSEHVETSVKDVDLQAIVPARSLTEVARTLTSQPEVEKVEIYRSEGARQLMFSLGNVVISTRLIEGSFPNTGKIVPDNHQTRAELDLEEFIKAVKVAQVFARDSAGVVRFAFDPAGLVTLEANTKQIGKNTGKVDGPVEGKKNKIAFNARYLLDALGVLKTERFEFTMTEPLKPGVFKPLAEGDSASDSTFFHLIMPVRVQD